MDGSDLLKQNFALKVSYLEAETTEEVCKLEEPPQGYAGGPILTTRGPVGGSESLASTESIDQ